MSYTLVGDVSIPDFTKIIRNKGRRFEPPLKTLLVELRFRVDYQDYYRARADDETGIKRSARPVAVLAAVRAI